VGCFCSNDLDLNASFARDSAQLCAAKRSLPLIEPIELIQIDGVSTKGAKVIHPDGPEKFFVGAKLSAVSQFNKRNKSREQVSKGEFGTAFQLF
jgi:hypothetical protein